MKTITFALFLFITVSAQSQWNSIWPNLSTNGEVKSMFFINENIGFLGGSLINSSNPALSTPALTKTINGGSSWTWLTLPVQNSTKILSIFFSDLNNGFFTTDNQNLSYKTTDGGNNWSQIYCQTNYPGKVYFKNNNVGFYYSDASSSNNFSYTTNGGSSWTAYYSQLGPIANIHFSNSTTNVGYLITTSGNIHKTNNNGLTWNLVHTGNTGSIFSSVYFIDDLVGFRASYGPFCGIEKTIDGGVTWSLFMQGGWKKILFSNPTTSFISKYEIGQVNTNPIYKANYQNSSLQSFSLMTGTNTNISNSDYIIDFQFPTANIGYAISTNKYLYKINTNLGLNENENLKALIYPNPAQKILNIENINLESENYFIFDINGKFVAKGKVKEQKIEIEALNSGIYLLEIGENLKKIKFVKN